MSPVSKLRRQTRIWRQNLPRQVQTRHSEDILVHLIRSGMLLHCNRVAGYLGTDGEVSLAPVFNHLSRSGVGWFLPALRPGSTRSLWFIEYRDGDRLATNRFGIPEPSLRRRPPTPAWSLDLILLPLVAFDVRGNRLGMGGGYYDRTLAFVRRHNRLPAPRLVGVAHEGQRVSELQSNPWDIPLDAVITETGFYTFEPSR